MVLSDYSIVTVTHNHSRIISSYCQSISTLPEGIVYLVDNHSSDDSPGILKRYAETDKKIRLLEYRGPQSTVRAANFGLSQAESEFVIYVQPWIRLSEELIHGLLTILNEDRDLSAVVPFLESGSSYFRTYAKFPGYLEGLQAGVTPVEQWFSGIRIQSEPGRSTPFSIAWCHSPVLCMRSESIEQTGYFDESFPEDLFQLDWMFRLQSVSGTVVQAPELKAEVIANRDQTPGYMNVIRSHVGLFKYFEKHFDGIHHQLFNLMVGGMLYLLLPVKLLIRTVKAKFL